MFVVMRLLSLVLVVAALMLMGGDVITSLEKGGEITVRSFEQVWLLLNKHSAEAFRAWLDRSLPTFLSHGVEAALALPGWAVTGVPGVILAFVFGRRAGPA
jgi:hypothetical protein